MILVPWVTIVRMVRVPLFLHLFRWVSNFSRHFLSLSLSFTARGSHFLLTFLLTSSSSYCWWCVVALGYSVAEFVLQITHIFFSFWLVPCSNSHLVSLALSLSNFHPFFITCALGIVLILISAHLFWCILILISARHPGIPFSAHLFCITILIRAHLCIFVLIFFPTCFFFSIGILISARLLSLSIRKFLGTDLLIRFVVARGNSLLAPPHLSSYTTKSDLNFDL